MLTEDATREPADAAEDGRLVVVVVDERTERHLLPRRGVVTVGRGRDADIRVRQPWVSRVHLRLHLDGDVASIEDAGSSYGVVVRGEALPAGTTTRLTPGDVVELGTTLLLLQRGASAPSAGPVTVAELEALLGEELARAARLGLVTDVLAALAPGAGPAVTLEDLLATADARLPLAREGDLVFTFASRSATASSLADRVDEQLTMRGVVAGLACTAAPRAETSAHTNTELVARVLVELRRSLAVTPRDESGEDAVLLFGPDTRDLRARLELLAARSDVLLVGEAGSGKSSLARLAAGRSARDVHALSARTFAGEARDLPPAGVLLLDAADALGAPAQAALAAHLGAHPAVRLVATTCVAPARWLEPSLAARFAGAIEHVPPLRERAREREALIRHFARVGAIGAGKRRLTIPADVMRRLDDYPWPGNVRELANVVVLAAASAPGAQLRLEEGALSPSEPARAADLRGQLASLERQRIVDALERHDHNQSAAARALGMPRNTLLARLREYGITRPKRSEPER